MGQTLGIWLQNHPSCGKCHEKQMAMLDMYRGIVKDFNQLSQRLADLEQMLVEPECKMPPMYTAEERVQIEHQKRINAAREAAVPENQAKAAAQAEAAARTAPIRVDIAGLIAETKTYVAQSQQMIA